MIRKTHGKLIRYCFPFLEERPVVHGVFARHGGHSCGPFASLNLGHTVGDAPQKVDRNHDEVYNALSIEPGSVVTARQVHGDRVEVVKKGYGGRCLEATDALISDVPGLTLLLRFADCVPILIYSPRGAIGLAHAGWKGTAKEIAIKSVEAMSHIYDCAPEEMYAGIGPSIGPCCFQVGEDVLDAFRGGAVKLDQIVTHPKPGDRPHLDLWRANALQLRAAGVGRVEISELCTSCRRKDFYSHRAEDGRTGRFGALLGLPPDNWVG